MQEDIVGTLHSVGNDSDVCSLCGFAYPTRLLTPREGDVAEGVRSEYEDTCPECGRLLSIGDEPGFTLDDELAQPPERWQ